MTAVLPTATPSGWWSIACVFAGTTAIEHVRDLCPMPPHTEQRCALFFRHDGPFSGAPIAKAAPMPGMPGRRDACVLATISLVPCSWVIALFSCSLKSSRFW